MKALLHDLKLGLKKKKLLVPTVNMEEDVDFPGEGFDSSLRGIPLKHPLHSKCACGMTVLKKHKFEGTS